MDGQPQLSRWERQIVDIVYARGEATVTAVVNAMADSEADPPPEELEPLADLIRQARKKER